MDWYLSDRQHTHTHTLRHLNTTPQQITPLHTTLHSHIGMQCRQAEWERSMMLDRLDDIWTHFLRVSFKHRCIVEILQGEGCMLASMPCPINLHCNAPATTCVLWVSWAGILVESHVLVLGLKGGGGGGGGQRGCRWLQCLVFKPLSASLSV